MNVRRFALRLAVGLLCFLVGWASAVLLGATRTPERRATKRVSYELVVPHFDPPPPPHFEMPPFGPSCRERVRARHAHDWRDLPRVEEFELRFEVPPPPPPPRPRRPGR